MAHIDVVTFNICGHPLMRPDFHTRANEFARQIEERAVDVVALQEVYTAKQVRYLQQKLPSLPHVAYKKGLLGQPRGALVVFSRHPLERPRFASFAGTATWQPSGRVLRVAGQVRLKGLLVTRLRESGLVIANAHPSHNPDGDWSPGNRFFAMHQAQLRVINAVCTKYNVKLIVGDFNVASGSLLAREFLDAGGWTDVFAADDPPTFHIEFLGPGHHTAKRIDYILVRGLQPEQTEVLFDGPVTRPGQPKMYVSDHMALRATVHVD